MHVVSKGLQRRSKVVVPIMPAPPVLVVDSETPTLVVQPTLVQVKPPPKSETIILAVPMLVDPLTGHDTRS